MKKNGTIKKIVLSILSGVFVAGIISCIATNNVFAKETTENVNGKQYIFEKDSHYEIDDSTSATVISDGTKYGLFSLSGDMKSISSVDGFSAYEVKSGNIDISYSCNNKFTDAEITEDKSKEVNKDKLSSNIMSGALILQTSFDGVNWITETTYQDLVGEKSTFNPSFYQTKDIQQVNGCYYRVIVAYETKKQLEDKKIAFVKVDNFEYKKYAEVYTFYLISSSENSKNAANPNAQPRKELGSKVKVKKDSGYAIQETLKTDDPHASWEIGTFYVNGYTRETSTKEGNPLFLKKFGDTVTLWFNLEQDINCLNGNDKLVIAKDSKASDQQFEVKPTDFERGTLIIRFTDSEGKKKKTIYTNYLEANTRTGADTKVELFEEGDYEVALDYAVTNKEGIDSTTYYRIAFDFSIRNGNCMFYIFDNGTGSELSDGAMTANGFKVDLAKSKYLTIDVDILSLSEGAAGHKTNLRYNTVAKDQEVFSDEGIYVFNIKNLYTGENTTKTIYVGTDDFMKVMSVTGLSIKEIDAKLAEGYTIEKNGTLLAPPEPEPEVEITEETTEDKEIVENTEDIIAEDVEDKEQDKISQVVEVTNSNEDIVSSSENDKDTEEVETAETKNSKSLPITGIVVALVVVGFGAYNLGKKRKNSGKEDKK